MTGQSKLIGRRRPDGRIDLIAARAISIETHTGAPHSLILCTDTPCLIFAGRWPIADLDTFTVRELDDFARYQNRPIRCDRCGNWLTSVVDGPDPRD